MSYYTKRIAHKRDPFFRTSFPYFSYTLPVTVSTLTPGLDTQAPVVLS